jgi:outer membrane protein OmpA-like peptidoglycan-associated protein
MVRTMSACNARWSRTCCIPCECTTPQRFGGNWVPVYRNFLPDEGEDMRYFPIVCAVGFAIVSGGCATKSYVLKTTDPINQKLDEQHQSLNQTSESLQKTQQTLTADETNISAANERATSADARAGDALNRAGEANTRAGDAANKADQATQQAAKVGRDVGDLKGQVDTQIANLDDYKKVVSSNVTFKFNSDKLDSDAKMQLDQLAQDRNKYKRYFISVEGFTDQIGDEEYNRALSRRRADAVVAYLVAQHQIPVYRIQMIGLGKINPVDDGKTSAARAKNRRVEVSVFSADANSMAGN